MSKEYQDGYKEGFKDGFAKGLEEGKKLVPLVPATSPNPIIGPTHIPPGYTYSTKCSKCGMEWKGAMNYYCSAIDCPVQPHAISTGSGVVRGAVGAGLINDLSRGENGAAGPQTAHLNGPQIVRQWSDLPKRDESETWYR